MRKFRIAVEPAVEERLREQSISVKEVEEALNDEWSYPRAINRERPNKQFLFVGQCSNDRVIRILIEIRYNEAQNANIGYVLAASDGSELDKERYFRRKRKAFREGPGSL